MWEVEVHEANHETINILELNKNGNFRINIGNFKKMHVDSARFSVSTFLSVIFFSVGVRVAS